MKHAGPLRDLDQDIADHIARETELNIERGMTPEAARTEALRRFGNVTLVTEDTRAVWVSVWLNDLQRDAVYALRTLRRSPTLTTTIALTLAVAIGLTTTVFSVVNAVLLRPLSYPDPDRLVWVATEDTFAKEEIVPRYEFQRWKDGVRAFDRLVAYSGADNTIGTISNPFQARVAWVSDDFWTVSGAVPELGRVPAAGEQNVLVLSHALFDREFHGDRSVVGKLTTLDGRPVTIAGVLRPDFRFEFVPPTRRGPDAKTVEAYAPMVPMPQDHVRSRGPAVNVVGRLRAGATLEQAYSEVDAARADIARASPSPYLDGMKLQMLPLREKLIKQTRSALLVLGGAVGLVLLIACANIASLLLARVVSRDREIAVRHALGAGRGRLLRQFLVESAMLALVGGVAGAFFARWCLATILRLVPHAAPRLAESVVDVSALGFALSTAVLTIAVFGVTPALFLRNTNMLGTAKAGARTISASRSSLRTQQLLVGFELALAVVLLVGAGLLVKSFWRMRAHDPRFHPERILTMKIPLSGPQYVDPQRRHAFAQELLAQARSLPGVEAAGVTPSHQIKTGLDAKEGRVPAALSGRVPTTLNATSAGYQEVMGLLVIAGRWITDDEPAAVVVMNQSLARREFGDDNPIGKTLWVQAITPPNVPTYAPIVGVVADLKTTKLDADIEPELYVPFRHVPIGAGIAAVIRTSGDPLTAVAGLRSAIAAMDKTQAVFDVKTLDTALAESVAPRRFTLFLLSTFAAVAMLLAVVGLYGLIAYSISQRTREIGIRLALGAQRRSVVQDVVRQSMQSALAGLTVGLVAGIGLTRMMAGLLYGVEPTDPSTFAAVAILVLLTALIASWGPAVRAALIEPTVALRQE